MTCIFPSTQIMPCLLIISHILFCTCHWRFQTWTREWRVKRPHQRNITLQDADALFGVLLYYFMQQFYDDSSHYILKVILWCTDVRITQPKIYNKYIHVCFLVWHRNNKSVHEVKSNLFSKTFKTPKTRTLSHNTSHFKTFLGGCCLIH